MILHFIDIFWHIWWFYMFNGYNVDNKGRIFLWKTNLMSKTVQLKCQDMLKFLRFLRPWLIKLGQQRINSVLADYCSAAWWKVLKKFLLIEFSHPMALLQSVLKAVKLWTHLESMAASPKPSPEIQQQNIDDILEWRHPQTESEKKTTRREALHCSLGLVPLQHIPSMERAG